MGNLTEFPTLQAARTLLNGPWHSIETQGGVITCRSPGYAKAFSLGLTLVRAAHPVLIYGIGFDAEDEGEVFGVGFAAADTELARSTLAGCRPGLKTVRQLPPEIDAASAFFAASPMSMEVGLGKELRYSGNMGQESGVPILWCLYKSPSALMLLYSDYDIPLNVGLTMDAREAAMIKAKLAAASVVTA